MVKIKTSLTILIYGITLLGVVPVFPYLDMISRTVFIAAFIVGCCCDRKGSGYVRALMPTLASIGFFLFYAFRFDRENLIEPAVNLLVILLSVRLLSDKTGRNSMQIVALSLFALAGSSLLSLSMAFLVYLILFLLAVAVFLVFLAFQSFGNSQVLSRPELKSTVAVALVMPVLSLPLLLLFFAIIPRSQYPLWNFLNGAGQKVAGFSEKVEPGTSASVTETKNVVFRAQSPPLAARELYWRGIVLNTFEGNAWVRSGKQVKEITVSGGGREVSQTIYPEPNTGRYLAVLNVPRQVSGVHADREADGVFVRKSFRNKRLRYDSTSVLSDVIAVKGEIDRELYLGKPAGMSPRVVELGRSLAAKGNSDRDRLVLLEDYFAERRFSYANKDLPRSQDPTDEFLFSKKSGNCEYFASSFALLLREMGVPSRLVGGYLGGTYNELGGYYAITEDLAHVWVEAYIEGRGWVMIDPTRFSANSGPMDIVTQKGIADVSFLLLDTLGYYWNQAVISYDMEKQLHILRKTNKAFQGFRFSVDWRKLAYPALAVLLCSAALIFRKKCRYVSREEKIVKMFLDKVGRKYPDAVGGPAAGLLEIAAGTGEPAVRKFAELYCGAVYRDRRLTDEEYGNLRRLLTEIR